MMQLQEAGLGGRGSWKRAVVQGAGEPGAQDCEWRAGLVRHGAQGVGGRLVTCGRGLGKGL